MPSKKDRQCRGCPTLIARETRSGFCASCYYKERASRVPSERIKRDQVLAQVRAEFADLNVKYKHALKLIAQQEGAIGIINRLQEGVASTYTIEPKAKSGTSEATPILVASDWHSEEIVKPAQVDGLNEFNQEIARERIRRFFQASLNLIKNHLNPGVAITQVLLALLGDFITGQIHEAENAESNGLLPVDAVIFVQNQIIAGIEFLLNHSNYEFVVVCKVGNHSRTTKRVRFGSETGHSLESLLYVMLANHFRSEKRVRFVFEQGYHTFVTVYDQVIRFHHGHAINYQGGIGGLFIPAYKAVSQWNKARRADLDVFGHFHQLKDGGNFVCNGSLIGYNAYALSIKADYERPSQSLILVDKKRKRTCLWPVLV